MRHDIKNIEASVKARLKNIAKDKNMVLLQTSGS